MVKDKLWIFSSFEYVNEDASVGYSAQSLDEFNALAQLASSGRYLELRPFLCQRRSARPSMIRSSPPGLDFNESDRSHWFLRGAFDLNDTKNDLVHEGALPSTGFETTSHYYSLLLSNQMEFTPEWIGNFVFQASDFHHVKVRNSNLGFGLAFPLQFDGAYHLRV